MLIEVSNPIWDNEKVRICFMQPVYNQKNTARFTLVIFLGAITGIITVVSIILFSPSTLGPLGVTLWFVNLLIFLTSLLSLAFFIVKNKKSKNQMITQNFNNSLRTGFLIAFAITFFLALRSLRSLTFKDVILLGLILFIIEMYFRTRKHE